MNLIEEKAPSFSIEVIDKNEAYTSKTSCLSSDVNKIQEMNNNKLKIIPTDLNGSRGVNKKRGLFKDTKLNKIINSDLNGAANHVKLGFPKVDLSVFRNHLFKVCNPTIIKSVSDFDNFLSNNEAERKTTLQKVA